MIRTRGRLVAFVFSMAGIFAPVVPLHAERIPRIELLRAVEIAGEHVSLADLLPRTAPESLRAEAKQISLGASPQLGNTRTLDASAIEKVAGADRDVLDQVVVPARMIVSRGARTIGPDEVFAAIQSALRQSDAHAAETLRLEDIVFESQVFVSPGDAGLQVLRMELDRGLGRIRFLLWPSRDPKVMPFFVTARLNGDAAATPNHSSAAFSLSGALHSSRGAVVALKRNILVGRGERATLVLHSDSLQMSVGVISLEAGELGQRIRVRTIENDKVLNVQVDGRSHVEVSF